MQNQVAQRRVDRETRKIENSMNRTDISCFSNNTVEFPLDGRQREVFESLTW